jgi:hypothetical protein
MDGLIVWIKKNQLLAGVIVLITVSALYSQFLSGPRSYEDCVLMVVKEAQTESSATYGKRACRAKFPAPPPPGSLPINRFGGIPVN